MDSEVACHRAPRADSNAAAAADPDLHSTSSSSSSSFSPTFRRGVLDVFKRHRPLKRQRSTFQPSRRVAPRQGSNYTSANSDPTHDDGKGVEGKMGRDFSEWRKDMASMLVGSQDASVTPPSMVSTVGNSEHGTSSCDELGDPQKECLVGHKELQDGNAPSGGVHDGKVIGLPNVSSHIGLLVSSDMKMKDINQVETWNVISQGVKQVGIPSHLDRRVEDARGPSHLIENFLKYPNTQSSVAGSSYTSTLVNSAFAPMITSTTCCSSVNQGSISHVNENIEGSNVNHLHLGHGDIARSTCSQPMGGIAISSNQGACSTIPPSSVLQSNTEVKSSVLTVEQHLTAIDALRNAVGEDSFIQEKAKIADVTNIQSQAPLSKTATVDLNAAASKYEKQETTATEKGVPAPRKRNSNSDAYIKVNGKRYLILKKIGSGGSSEVHKVLSSDCNTYALKKIKLKGRDYATAFGFCQEIVYLNKLKGKSNIIQLIDFEVTDKGLLQEVMAGSIKSKDCKLKDDGYIYMVLEYGEIDLAHMLSHKWKDIDCDGQTIDDDWLRFYWKQILLAVNTIHEERIVHSDLKPANFLLVRGSLKLIDFGIAKAIMSDTTNIQRDSQVGTLSYMSPEAFRCNETDADGNIIKCGRSSDIWSLGCILYQMVYGSTPFAEYKTFWTKFKVITDPNHEIKYPPLSNPWLLDLMKKCLLWDRNKRWRIPQLLEHPFFRPPIPPQTSSCLEQTCKLLQLVALSCTTKDEAATLCDRLNQALKGSTNFGDFTFTFSQN